MNDNNMFNLPKIKETLQRIERPVIYFILVTLVILEILSLFFQPIKDLIANKGTLFIFIVLFLIFRYIAEHIEKPIMSYSDNFNDAMSMLFRDVKSVEQVDFIGVNGRHFYPEIGSRKIKIEKMRVLVINPDPNISLFR